MTFSRWWVHMTLYMVVGDLQLGDKKVTESRLGSPGWYVEAMISMKNKDDTPPKFNSSPLKNGGWKTTLSYWVLVTFQGRFLLNFRRVSQAMGSACCRSCRVAPMRWRNTGARQCFFLGGWGGVVVMFSYPVILRIQNIQRFHSSFFGYTTVI